MSVDGVREQRYDKVSILIRCYEYTEYTENTVSSIIKTARSNYDIIIHPRKASAAVNSNMLIDLSRAKTVILMDDDLEFTQEGWDFDLIDSFFAGAEVGCVSPQLTDKDGTPIGPKPIRTNNSVSMGGEIWGACLLFQPNKHIRYDENYIKTTCDDTDFLYQWIKAGYHHMTDTRVKVKHMRELTAQSTVSDKKSWFHKNYAYLISKWRTNGKFPDFGKITYFE